MRFYPSEKFRIFQQRIKVLLTQPFIKIIFFLPILLVIGTTIVIIIYYSQLPPEIPLYYSRPWGADQLTSPLFLFILPLGAMIWYLLTVILIAFQTYQYRVFAQLLLIFSLFVALFTSYTVGTIIRLVL